MEAIIKAVIQNPRPIIIILIVVFVGVISTIWMLILFFKTNEISKTKDGIKIDAKKNTAPTMHETCINHKDHLQKVEDAKLHGKRDGVMYSDIRHQLLSERNTLIRELLSNEADKLYHDFYEKNLIEIILEKDNKANPTTHQSYMIYNSFIGRYVNDLLKRKTREYLTSIKIAEFSNKDLFNGIVEDAFKTLWSTAASFEDRYFSMIDQGSMIFTRKEHAEKELQRQHIFIDIIYGFFTKVRSVVEDYTPRFKKLKDDYGITDDFLENLGSSEGNMFR